MVDSLFRPKKALIIGGGLSGLGAALLLKKIGAEVRVTDRSKISPRYQQQFLALTSEILESQHSPSDLDQCDLVVCSPGVPQNHPLLTLARTKAIAILSEIDLAMTFFKGDVIAVTGTNGKSTICAMIQHILQALGLNALAGGNFGDPPSKMIAEDRAPGYLVLELSSYQLELSRKVRPKVAIFANFSFDHLGRHGTLENYFRTKWSIFDHLHRDGLAIASPEILHLAQTYSLPTPKHLLVIDSLTENWQGKLPESLRSPHNFQSCCLSVAAAAHATGREALTLRPLLRDFHGLPFRNQKIGTINNFDVINDSKSTNVDSTVAALKGCSGPVILLMGGQGKGERYTALNDFRDKIGLILTFGASGQTIFDDVDGTIQKMAFASLKETLRQLPKIVDQTPLPILLSPGCASFDEFDNFEHRGQFFTDELLMLGILKVPKADS